MELGKDGVRLGWGIGLGLGWGIGFGLGWCSETTIAPDAQATVPLVKSCSCCRSLLPDDAAATAAAGDGDVNDGDGDDNDDDMLLDVSTLPLYTSLLLLPVEDGSSNDDDGVKAVESFP